MSDNVLLFSEGTWHARQPGWLAFLYGFAPQVPVISWAVTGRLWLIFPLSAYWYKSRSNIVALTHREGETGYVATYYFLYIGSGMTIAYYQAVHSATVFRSQAFLFCCELSLSRLLTGALWQNRVINIPATNGIIKSIDCAEIASPYK